MNSDTLWAWAAGIIDGEGTICLAKNSHARSESYCLGLSVEMSHLLTIQKLRRIFGCGKQYERQRKKPYKKMYSIMLHGKEAIDTIKLLLPYLVTKRSQADLAIEFMDRCWREWANGPATQEIQNLRQIMYEEMQELNKRGADDV